MIKFFIIFRKSLHEPLVHFFFIAALIFLIGEWHRKQVDVYRISIDPERISQLENRYAMQFGTQPDAYIVNRLVDEEIHDEILFREAVILKLDKGDEIVRRRIVQKMRFFVEDVNAPPEPSDAELEAFYTAHADRYMLPARVTFHHLFFSADIDQADARTRASAALEQLTKNKQALDRGDSFPDHTDFSNYAIEQVNRIFGGTEFSDAVFAAPLQQWVGPFQSAYGWHLIYVEARNAKQPQPFSVVRDKVRADYLIGVQQKANALAFDRIAKKYTVVRVQR
jgi:hypothetical protein